MAYLVTFTKENGITASFGERVNIISNKEEDVKELGPTIRCMGEVFVVIKMGK